MSEERTSGSERRFGLRVLFALVVLFLILRLPVVMRQIPAQDEDYFAVPGLTILHDGIPRIPYMPARNDDSAFYRCDRILFTLPPLYFYLQAAFYCIFGASTGVARLACVACGIAAVFVLFELTRRLTGCCRAAVWGGGLYLFSRVLYFPCVIARPDMLCGLLGLLCILFSHRFSQRRKLSDAGCAGLCGGLGMLAHPFALVFCVQSGIWLLMAGDNWRNKVISASLFTGLALAAFSLWGLLIVQEPGLFRVQFTNSVLGQAGPGLFERLILPFESFRTQAQLYLEHLGTPQTLLLTAATLFVGLRALQTRESKYVVPAMLVLSGIYLHVACQGSHPTKGYWVYTAGLQFICLGATISEMLGRLEQRITILNHRPVSVLCVCILSVPFVFGSGVRTFVAHLSHWNDLNYDAPRFTQSLMDRYSRTEKLVVDPGYVFDFYRAGYDVVLGLNYSFFFDVTGADYDYVIGGPTSIRDKVPECLHAIETDRIGSFDDPFACRSILYRHPSRQGPSIDD